MIIILNIELQIVSKTVHTPLSPYYIEVHIQVCYNSKIGRETYLSQKYETVLKHVEVILTIKISNDYPI